jgi:hypothetical protein
MSLRGFVRSHSPRANVRKPVGNLASILEVCWHSRLPLDLGRGEPAIATAHDLHGHCRRRLVSPQRRGSQRCRACAARALSVHPSEVWRAGIRAPEGVDHLIIRGTARNDARLFAMVKRLGRRHQPPNLLFLCGWYRRALAGWHRLASGLVRRRKDGTSGTRWRPPSSHYRNSAVSRPLRDERIPP